MWCCDFLRDGVATVRSVIGNALPGDKVNFRFHAARWNLPPGANRRKFVPMIPMRMQSCVPARNVKSKFQPVLNRGGGVPTRPHCTQRVICRSLLVHAIAIVCSAWAVVAAETPVDGQFPPPKPPAGKWEQLFSGTLEERWTGMSMSIRSPLITTAPDPDRVGEYILHIGRGPTGLIRSMKAYENFILEYEFRHLTEAPNANGGKGTSGNSGLLICHSAFPAVGGPYPREGHEIQVCNLGNGSWYTSHGDTFTLPGSISAAIPDPRFGVSHSCGHRSMPVVFNGSKTGEWNRIRITCFDGLIQNEVNGTLASSLLRATPRVGYMSFESEGAPVEFRNMRIQELPPDLEMNPKHRVPLLPGPMTTDYLTERKATELPVGNFIASVDANAPLALSALASGLGLPDAPVTGRIILQVRDGKISVTVKDKEFVAPQPLPGETKGTLHLEAGKFGHVLIFKPVGK